MTFYRFVGGAFVDALKADKSMGLLLARLQRDDHFKTKKQLSLGVFPELATVFKTSEIYLMESMAEEILIPRENTTFCDPYDVLYYDPGLEAYVAAVRGTMATKDFAHSTGKDGLLGTIGSHGHDDLVSLRSIGIDYDGYVKRSLANMITQKTDDQESLLDQWRRRIKACEKGKVLYLSGHSLGAAIAQVYALVAELEGSFEAVHLSLYGTFPIYDKVAADAFNKETRIICNNFQYLSDPVPKMKNLVTALIYRYFLSLQIVEEWQQNDPTQITKHVGKVWYGNFAWAHDAAVVFNPKLGFTWAHQIAAYMDGFVSPEMWASWDEFQRNKDLASVVRPSNDKTRAEAFQDAEQHLYG
ncbi:hypothetical protein Aspvir_010185 [Aspergillus viridinutans]|uniref:Fungal lipase-type domain-containing protein n=1 Tax=Aspergillus viridinutans TaxID=75553 RepID=A0A9P3C1X6_ASPVI|nr:uncharacterized protein Aspvir_010185 [Aspergillus viridinutans]GIK06067.1 hypothetical protein Aspvir_010185 [Aspergillus viridinutans]